MIAVIQRVRRASVSVKSEVIASIGQGLVVLLGIAREDTSQDVLYMVNKIPRIRIFSDSEGIMNDSVLDTGRELLLISQFTLLGNTAKGRRPSFERAASSQTARVLHDEVLEKLQALKVNV